MQSFILGRSFIPFSFHPSVYFLEFSSCKAWWRHKTKILEGPTRCDSKCLGTNAPRDPQKILISDLKIFEFF